MAGLTGLFSLEGRWSVRRTILHADGTENTFEGVTSFQRSGHRLIQDEDGYLSMRPDQEPLRATRRYVWEKDGNRLECAFDDNRPFHTVPLGVDRPETTYLCPPDRYRVSYDFSEMPCWRSVWNVEGPKKEYVMTTDYSPEIDTL